MAHTRASEPENYGLHLGARGRLVREDDQMIPVVQPDRTMRLMSLREQLKKCRGMYNDPSGRSLVAELIRERREEARRENGLASLSSG